MTSGDQCISIHPYFRVPPERDDAVMKLCEQFVDRSSREPLCLYYGFTKSEQTLHCREGYRGAAGVIAHLDNVGDLLQEIMQLCELVKLEVHGDSDELEKIKPVLKDFSVEYFKLKIGFRI